MNNKYLTYVLRLIVVIAAFLRFYALGTNPPALNWDEVAWGYNAYTIGIDGRDEFGVLFPYKYLESFGDFKPPLYAYLTIIPIKIFGLTEFAVRLPSALFGTLTVLLSYFLVKEILHVNNKIKIPNSKQAKNENWKVKIALVTAGLLAISPWHVSLSRVAFEANVSTFFIVLGVWAFLFSVQNRKWLIVLSAISFGLSFYIFNTARIVTPLLAIVLAVGFRNQLLQMKKQVIVAIVFGGIIVLPLVGFLFSPQASLRFEEVNIFSDITVIERANQQIENDDNALWSKIIHNRRLAYGVEYLNQYFKNFSPSFLFLTGDENHKFGTKDVGLMYLWELPFFIAGLLFLFRKKIGNWWVIPLWILIGIIPAATARENPHALRILTIIPMFQLISAIGIVSFVAWIRDKNLPSTALRSLYGGLAFIIAICLLYYLHGYYVHYPRETAKDWNYTYKESIKFVQNEYGNYDQFNITRRLGRPYAYYAFYMQIPPSEFRKEAIVERDQFGFVEVKAFDKLKFGEQPEDIDTDNGKILYIDEPERVPEKAKVIKEFYHPGGDVGLVAYEMR